MAYLPYLPFLLMAVAFCVGLLGQLVLTGLVVCKLLSCAVIGQLYLCCWLVIVSYLGQFTFGKKLFGLVSVCGFIDRLVRVSHKLLNYP